MWAYTHHITAHIMLHHMYAMWVYISHNYFIICHVGIHILTAPSEPCRCTFSFYCFVTNLVGVHVLDHVEGVCVDPRRGDAILGVRGPRPPKGDSEHQLSLDRGGEKT
jgi:hypothetical protein